MALAESFERIHRSNLIGMGILPLQFTGGANAGDAGPGLGPSASRWRPSTSSAGLPSPAVVKVTAEKPDGSAVTFDATASASTRPTEGRCHEKRRHPPIQRLRDLIEEARARSRDIQPPSLLVRDVGAFCCRLCAFSVAERAGSWGLRACNAARLSGGT
ncbi:MAG: hypothetical protein ACLTDR_09220 [Adlercreutzia equolifaciens]